MKTSVVRHPASAPLIVIHQWQVDALNGDTTAAALFSYFEYWHGVKLEIASRNGKEDDPKALIQHHTEPELEAGLLGTARRKAIAKSLKVLDKAGILTKTSNPYNPHDRTRHYIFNSQIAQMWADRWDQEYKAHKTGEWRKYPICIPGNLAAIAIGQKEDCNRPKGIIEEAKRDAPSSQNDCSIKPFDLDPKTTSKTSLVITPEINNPPKPPKGGDVSEVIDAEIVFEEQQTAEPQVNSSSLVPVKPSEEPEKASSGEAAKSFPKKIKPEHFEIFRQVYNQNKPDCWAVCQSCNKNRLKMVQRLVDDCGDSSVATLESALQYAASDRKYWGIWEKGCIETVFRDSRYLQWSEHWAGKQSSQTNGESLITANQQQQFNEYMQILRGEND